MQTKRCLCVLMACVLSVACFGMNAGAIDSGAQEPEIFVSRASGRFSMDIPGGALVTADQDFPMEAGETVTIKASYSPFDASVDFGLIDSDGSFHYFNTNDGTFDKTIKIKERGYYTLAVRNNSSDTINVSGYVNY
ncbi:hypothetical protein [uncultured Flavonifractor sp.]|uniref:hypothetical protein n=1 Tax=uncultured Flavonifractor sp. TaxID=1193534 RepID=UPI00174BA936|nr:hypothetical protein [uncultured Flavonifractor sp.]